MIEREQSQKHAVHDQSWKMRCTIIYVVAYMTLGFVISGLGPLIPFKAAVTNLLETDYGIVFTMRGLGYFSGSFIVARLQQTMNAHNMLLSGLLLLGSSSYFGVLTDSLSLMSFLFLLNGIGCSCVDIMCQSSLIQVYEDKVEPYMQFLHFTFGFGAFVSPLLLAWQGAASFKLYAVACAICAVCAWRIDSPQFHKEHSKKSMMKHEQHSIIVQENPEEPNSPRRGEIPIPSSTDWMLRCFFFTYVGIEVGYGGWVSTYATMSDLVSKQSAALCSSVFWGCITIGRLAAVPLALKYESKDQLKWLVYGCLGSSILNGLFIMTGNGKLAVFLGSAFFGLAMSAVYPMLMSLPPCLKLKTSAATLSAYVLSGAAGESLVPVLVGILIEKIGSNSLYASCLLTSLFFCGCYWRIMQKHDNKTGSTTLIEGKGQNGLMIELLAKKNVSNQSKSTGV